MAPLVVMWLCCLVAGAGWESFRVFVDLGFTFCALPICGFAVGVFASNWVRAVTLGGVAFFAYIAGIWLTVSFEMDGIERLSFDSRLLWVTTMIGLIAICSETFRSRLSLNTAIFIVLLALCSPLVSISMGPAKPTGKFAESTEFNAPDLKIKVTDLNVSIANQFTEKFANFSGHWEIHGLPDGIVPLVIEAHPIAIVDGEKAGWRSYESVFTQSAINAALRHETGLSGQQLQTLATDQDRHKLLIVSNRRYDHWEDDAVIEFDGVAKAHLFRLSSIGQINLAAGAAIVDEGFKYRIGKIQQRSLHIGARSLNLRLGRYFPGHSNYQNYTGFQDLDEVQIVLHRPNQPSLAFEPSRLGWWNQGMFPFRFSSAYFSFPEDELENGFNLVREIDSGAELEMFGIKYVGAVEIPLEIAPTTKAKLFGDE